MARSLIATEIGVKRAREALIDLGMNQTILVKRLGFARATVGKFFQRKPLDHQYFTGVCNMLKLEWRDIAEINEQESISVKLPEICEQENIDKISIAMSAKNTSQRHYTDTNSIEGKPLLSFAIAGTIDQVDQKILDVIIELLRQKTSDISVAIVDIQEGSIKLILTGTPEALEMIQSLYRSGELTEVEGIPIENVELLVDKSEIAKNQNTADLRSDLSEQFGNHPRMKVVEFNAGEKFFLMLVPNGSVEEAWNALDQGTTQDVRPLFSLVTASPTEAIQTGQIIDITGDGDTFVMEDMRVDQGYDRDYNDLIFQVKGATINTATLDDLIIAGEMQSEADWRITELGQGIVEYSSSMFKNRTSAMESFVPCLSKSTDWRNIELDQEIIKYRTPKLVKNRTPIGRTILNLLKLMYQLGLLYTESHSIVNWYVSELFFRPGKHQKSPSVIPLDFAELETDIESNSIAVDSEDLLDSIGVDAGIDCDWDPIAEDTSELLIVEAPDLLSEITGGLGTVTDSSAKVAISWIFDGGAYEGEVGVVSSEFIEEVIRRALADIIVDDTTEGARFSGDMEELESVVEPPISEPALEKYEFPKENQPLVGFIDTHLTTGNPDINYSNITFGKDYIENDSDPTMTSGKGIHLDHVLGIVEATQDNGLGIDGINDDVDDSEEELELLEDSIESESDLFSQVISGYYTVENTGKVVFEFIADSSNYRGQLAVISMSGMENLDINSREFLQEALDRAIFGSESKLGYIINGDID